jgi:limonene-1,2-epoxide hydrolase
MNKGKPIAVDGITMLKIADDRVVYHRDYYDLGQMVYENIPLIGRLIKKIKRALS